VILWLRSWRLKIKQHPIITTGIIACITLIFSGYWFHWAWTGFNKTLWDWMQLLIIPIVLAFIAIWFNRKDRQSEQKIASDNQRETALQTYIDKMAELLENKKLRESQPNDEVRKIARARTLTILTRLDPGRKKSVLNFLHEAALIDRNECIINLERADLRGADLFGASLHNSELSLVDLLGAELSGAWLEGANLYGANLIHAVLSLTVKKVESDTEIREVAKATRHRYSLRDLEHAAFVSGYFISMAAHIKTNARNVNLSSANLSMADLSGVDLYQAHLRDAILIKANLQRALLQEANLIEANLVEADLQGADLRKADLSKAIMYGTDLTGADLSGAVLVGTQVKPEQLEKAKSLKGATMPDGSIHP
jgi:uncharacterized protein YjbI with pentapeptide repeats